MKLLILSPKEIYKGKLQLFANSCVAFGHEVQICETVPEDIVEFCRKNNFDAIVHRNEHGRLFADGCLKAIYALVKAKIPVLSLDLGYFAHYKSFMLDYYVETQDGLRSSIYDEWVSLPEKVDWQKAPAYIQDYRNEVFQSIARADNTKYSNRVAIWMQWTTDLLRPELGKMHQAQWVNSLVSLIRAQGKEPIVKHNPIVSKSLYEHTVPLIDPTVTILCDRKKQLETCPRLTFDKHANANLAAGCDYHIVLCSSVTNILSLSKKPVIAMGQSWFNALGIFSESVNFPSELSKPKVINNNREKWMNWWLQRQKPFAEIASLLPSIVEKALSSYARASSELWKYDFIYNNQSQFKHYGSRNHGKKALPIVLDLQPKSLVDIGCGHNDFTKLVKKYLKSCRTLGVDPCCPSAELKCSAQQLNLPNKSFQLLTAFDVLEHIPEPDLSQVLKEFVRVSDSFLFRVSTKSCIKSVVGQLHPTVKELDWWLELLRNYAETLQEKDGYIFGHWK